jgi:glutamate formiminotransferase / formiminotetrahydrofolate cyclodeaminase
MLSAIKYMNKIVECVPNISEGRDQQKLELIVSAIASVTDAILLDCEMDGDHNRSVITFAGDPEAVLEAAFRAAATAVELIDLNHHSGEHPRIGALDVLPFVPIEGVSLEECIGLARKAGERIARELNIPVYLYERAATRPERVDLADVRRGEFEGLRQAIETDPARKPDFGEAKIHPTAGAMAIGARQPLIAYNINLATQDLSIAKKIAKAVRGRDGGLQNVKALGLELKNRGQTQVSMNLVNFRETPIFRVFEMVKREAERHGVALAGSEFVGLVPQSALNACTDFYLRVANFNEDLIFEHRLQTEMAKRGRGLKPVQLPVHLIDRRAEIDRIGAGYPAGSDSPSLDKFAEEVADSTLTPDGGVVAAYTGVLAASLGSMVCNMTIGQKAEVEEEVRSVLYQLDRLKEDLRLAMNEEEDIRVLLIEAMTLPRDTDGERLARMTAIEEATKSAVALPLRVAQGTMEVLELLSELSEIGNPAAYSNLAVAGQLAISSMRGAAYDVLSHLLSINDDEFNRNRRAELSELFTRGQTIADEIEALFFRLYPR